MSLEPEVRRGGGLPFGMVCSRWVCDPRYSANARTLYSILVTYSDTQSRDTGRGKPYRKELASQLGTSVSTLDRVLLEMEVAGLVTVERRADPANPKLNDSNLYVLHDAAAWNGTWEDPLPPGMKAADVAKDILEARRQAKREVEGGVTGEATPGVTGEARVASPVTPNVYNPVHNPDRDVVDVRRTTTGSGAAGDAGGCAASGKTKPQKPTLDERQAVEEVWQLLPADLAAAVPRNARGLQDAILDALAVGTPRERTPDQLVTHRVSPRWARHWAAEFEAGHLDKPVGALRAMLERDPLCNDDRCDEHVNVDTGQSCRACERTREDRRPDQGIPQQQSAPRLPDTRPAGGETFTPPPFQPEPAREGAGIGPSAEYQQLRAAQKAGRQSRGRDLTPYMPTT
ncbi:hypothetical protein [Streptomyces sp. Ag109_O5-1]|uniref:hypothetical protein n=1 Tax=Streptomyces sp. Ag109_O5-1 TaxID=1938851 RepID=UPI000F506458|nr:hypothetical protein [Streptomyces sp. Ag109_O5-1]